jgi:signal transduction histidine kinase
VRSLERLEQLYEISKVFASIENVDQPFDPALGIVTKTLPLRSAVLIETDDVQSRMVVWPSEGQTAEQVAAVKGHVEEAYRYLAGAASTEALELTEQAGLTTLPEQAEAAGTLLTRLIVIPLVVAHRPVFGALQLEGATPFDKTDLIFVNAVANQLAIALDRERMWQRDVARRERAEEEEIQANTRRLTAEKDRGVAETLKEKYEALAAENARLYAQAQRAVSAREQILAIVSHDLKSPLGAILMTTDALAKRGVLEERRRGLPQAVGRIQRSAQRMLRLIEDLLDFASIEAGHLAIRKKPQDPGAMAQETLASFEGLAHEKGLELTVEVASELPQVFCDRDRILQVLSNLVGNAAHVTPEGGHIVLRVEVRGAELLFAVCDDGPGISPEDLKHLFDRYWRSDEVEYKGTGLGLAIAKGIVEAHGGQISVESALGHGSTFLFSIPAADMTFLFQPPALAGAASEKASEKASGKDVRQTRKP